MKNNTETRTESPEELVAHIGRLMSEAEALLVGPVAEETNEKFREFRNRFGQLQSKATAFYGDARKRVVAGAKVTDETIRSHPYESLAIALGAGVVLGALIRRSTRY